MLYFNECLLFMNTHKKGGLVRWGLILAMMACFSACNKTAKLEELKLKNGIYYNLSNNKPYSGKINERFVSGQDSLVAELDSGAFTGNYLVYYQNGRVKDSVIYEKGDIISFKSFNSDGSILKIPKNKLIFKNGLAYLDEDKNVKLFSGLTYFTFTDYEGKSGITTESYINGMLDGEFLESHGNIKNKSHWKKGKKNGYELSYDKGKLSSSCMFINGEPEGKNISYYENGKISSLEQWKHGKKVGTWTDFYENGNKSFVYIYRNGESDYFFVAYYQNGVIQAKGHYINEQRDGVFKWYNLDGTLSDEVMYKEGAVMERCACCGKWYIQSKGWNARPAFVTYGPLWDYLGPAMRGGPYCSQSCARRCG